MGLLWNNMRTLWARDMLMSEHLSVYLLLMQNKNNNNEKINNHKNH